MTDYAGKTENEAMFDDSLEKVGNESAPKQDDKTDQRLRKIQSWWAYARAIQDSARAECLRDHEFYDGDQWKEEDKEEIEARGQVAIVFNRVKPTADWVLGSERKNRIDHKVLPRTDEDSKGAEIKTQLLKYLSDVNNMPNERSQAFKDGIISGLGWVEVGVCDDVTREPIFIDYEDWRNIWYDPLSVRTDIRDARFLIRRKRVDLDVACAMFPDHAGGLRIMTTSASSQHDYYGEAENNEDTDLEAQIELAGDDGTYRSRSRVELVECWYKTPAKVEIIVGEDQDLGTLRGQRYRPEDPSHKELIDSGYASVTNAMRMEVRCMIFSGSIVLQDIESPYNHDKLPFVPLWGYRKKKDNTQYGIIRNLRDVQDDLNKRRSKALFILSTNQVIADDDAVEDWDELAEEVSRPDGIIRKRKGSELTLNNDRGLAQEHVELMSQDAEYIEATGGVTDEQMGRETNATSGKAIEARKEQGNIVNSELFDNLRVATQLLGEILLSLVEQYYTDQKIFRITNEKNQPEFVEINGVDPEGESLNDITSTKADFMVDSSAWTASVRQATFETLMELSTRLDPQIAMNLLDLIIDMSDIPGKDDLVSRIRAITGQADPDAEDDPEAMAQEQAQAQAEEAERILEETRQKLEIQKLESEVNKNNMDATATQAGIRYDEEKLRIEKAKALNDIQMGNKMLKEKSSGVAKSKDRTKETKKAEHGLKSDNKVKGGK